MVRGAPAELMDMCRRELPRVRGALTLYLGEPAVAEELTQEAFTRLCRDWERVQRLDRPGAWVHRVAMNLAMSELRRRRAERRALQRIDRAAPSMPDLADRRAVRDALRDLPGDERAAIVLRYYADLSIVETAEVLGVPVGTVKTRTRRGIERLREAGLHAEVEDDDDA
jgi:RNA polymerase sigma-70 factor (ECF subfamily)